MKIVFVALGPRQNSNKDYVNDVMALNARTHFIFITLNENPIAKPVVFAGHFVEGEPSHAT